MATSRVRVYLGCSLDGCIAGPRHDLSFLHEFPPTEEGGGLSFEDFLGEVGVVLMGRRTYQVPLDHDLWPYGETPVLVATHRALPPAPQGGDARPVEGTIEDLIAHARSIAGDADIYLDGGELVRQGLDAGLVDELCLTFLPVVLGDGVRLWEGLRNRADLRFHPPALHGGIMAQVRADIVGRD